ncbi:MULTISPECIES: alpha/beta hydrolase [unclassified Arthrobacter]|uniref:alpha/beta fold hydrolase n=1 Tax=unclassified Arthrobacter TaxID=235627 RepID=UPI0033964831
MEALTDAVEAIQVRNSGFDPLGPVVCSAVVGSGRTVNYIDDGAAGAVPLLFLGGAGTTVRAFRLLEFARSFRQEMGIRVVSVERNGLGQTVFDPAVGPDEYAADVWSLLDTLNIGQVSVLAISGGGPYAAAIIAARPGQVRSLHLACAFAEMLEGADAPMEPESVAADPVAWWRFPAESSVHSIPGFVDSVIEEATRGLFAKGRDVPPDGLRQAFGLYASEPLRDLSAVQAPVFLYWGSADELVPLEQMRRWTAALAGRETVERVYPGEGHDVQYRHWDQILADVKFLGRRIVASCGGRTHLIVPEEETDFLAAGGILGLAAWQKPANAALQAFPGPKFQS